MHLDAQLAHRRQTAVDQQPLVQQAGGDLDQIGLEPPRQTDRIVGGIGGNPYPRAQAVVTQGLELVP